MSGGHELTHRQFTNGRWTPACACGWYSPRCEHADFERHLRRVAASAPSSIDTPDNGTGRT